MKNDNIFENFCCFDDDALSVSLNIIWARELFDKEGSPIPYGEEFDSHASINIEKDELVTGDFIQAGETFCFIELAFSNFRDEFAHFYFEKRSEHNGYLIIHDQYRYCELHERKATLSPEPVDLLRLYPIDFIIDKNTITGRKKIFWGFDSFVDYNFYYKDHECNDTFIWCGADLPYAYMDLNYQFIDGDRVLILNTATNVYKKERKVLFCFSDEVVLSAKVSRIEKNGSRFSNIIILKYALFNKLCNVELSSIISYLEIPIAPLTRLDSKMLMEYTRLFDSIITTEFGEDSWLAESSVGKKNETCFVYLMKDTSNGSYKIGISSSPEIREKTLQSDKPTIVMLACKKYPSRQIALAIEKALHDTFEDKHRRGEWYNLSSSDVSEVLEMLK